MQKTCEGREAFGLAQLPCPCQGEDWCAAHLVALLQHDPGLDQGTVQILPLISEPWKCGCWGEGWKSAGAENQEQSHSNEKIPFLALEFLSIELFLLQVTFP